MPSVNEMYPSKWLTAADLEDQETTLTIRRIQSEDIGDGEKWVVYFDETQKGLVLNKTNTQTIAALHGKHTDDWEDQQITLYPAWVDFQGKQVEAIRVRPKKARSKGAAEAPRQPAAAPARSKGKTAEPFTQQETDAPDPDEDLPF